MVELTESLRAELQRMMLSCDEPTKVPRLCPDAVGSSLRWPGACLGLPLFKNDHPSAPLSVVNSLKPGGSQTRIRR
jgi:hypothetical protein